jgi:hypothetical protein
LQANPKPKDGRPEDHAGLTTGMAPVSNAHPKAGQNRNGDKDGVTSERDKHDEVRNAGNDDNRDENKIPKTKGGHRATSICLPKSKETPFLAIRLEGLASHIEYMKDHAIIAKFIGFWPMVKDLI